MALEFPERTLGGRCAHVSVAAAGDARLTLREKVSVFAPYAH
jgi:hypothetical protein